MWKNGDAGGACYKISYDGAKATNPGRPGSDVIQVIDKCADKNFDCFIDAFKEITGSTTGILPISFAQVPCPVSPYGGVATATAGNRYFIIVVFSDFKMQISSADVARLSLLSHGSKPGCFPGEYPWEFKSSLVLRSNCRMVA